MPPVLSLQQGALSSILEFLSKHLLWKHLLHENAFICVRDGLGSLSCLEHCLDMPGLWVQAQVRAYESNNQ